MRLSAARVTADILPSYLKWKELVEGVLARKDLPRGPVFFGKERPFQFNPEFTSVAPLSEKSKEVVYQKYLEDPEKWTPRALSKNFGISLERARAIILLKNHEIKMTARGYVPNAQYVETMEEITDSSTRIKDIKSSKANLLNNRKPTFITVPESFVLTQEQAAEILQLPIFKTRNTWADFVIPAEAVEEQHEVISKEPLETGKHSFMITDIGGSVTPSNRRVIVRETDGTLRHATTIERYHEGKRIWGSSSSQFIRSRQKSL